jgi:hypothetical protein
MVKTAIKLIKKQEGRKDVPELMTDLQCWMTMKVHHKRQDS